MNEAIQYSYSLVNNLTLNEQTASYFQTATLSRFIQLADKCKICTNALHTCFKLTETDLKQY